MFPFPRANFPVPSNGKMIAKSQRRKKYKNQRIQKGPPKTKTVYRAESQRNPSGFQQAISYRSKPATHPTCPPLAGREKKPRASGREGGVNQPAIKISEGFALNGRLRLSVRGSLMQGGELLRGKFARERHIRCRGPLIYPGQAARAAASGIALSTLALHPRFPIDTPDFFIRATPRASAGPVIFAARADTVLLRGAEAAALGGKDIVGRIDASKYSVVPNNNNIEVCMNAIDTVYFQ